MHPSFFDAEQSPAVRNYFSINDRLGTSFYTFPREDRLFLETPRKEGGETEAQSFSCGNREAIVKKNTYPQKPLSECFISLAHHPGSLPQVISWPGPAVNSSFFSRHDLENALRSSADAAHRLYALVDGTTIS